MGALEVVSAACSVYLKDGAATLLYKGAKLPAAADLREGETKRLKDGGFVAPVEEPAAAAPEGPPARNASTEVWAAYALTQGATEADLEGKTRDYIRDLCDLKAASS